MIRILLSIAISFFCVSSLMADEAWAWGVTRDDGWYDYNKSQADSTYGTVAGMCWAASASNVISWWYGYNSVSDSQGVSTDPWRVFQVTHNDVGSTPNYALNWWVNGAEPTWDESLGTYVYPSYIDTSFDGKEFPGWIDGGFFKNDYNTSAAPIRIANVAGNETTGGSIMAQSLVKALQDGYGISLSTYSDNGGAHALTLWGMEYSVNDSGVYNVSKMWLTDSDDSMDALVEYSVSYKDAALTLSDGGNASGLIIKYADGLRLDNALVPEPSSSALCLIALATFVARRRRVRND